MTAAIRVRRKNTFNLFREAHKLASFDEFPMLRPEVDPQLHASLNSADQPFWLTCEKDCVLAQLGGQSRVLFRTGPVRYFDAGPGEFVYVPGGTAHRVLVRERGVQVRYKAMTPGAEAVSWFCETCDAELYRHQWGGGTLAQTGYADAVEQFNAEAGLRRCGNCGGEHGAVDSTPFRWRIVAETIERGEDDDD